MAGDEEGCGWLGYDGGQCKYSLSVLRLVTRSRVARETGICTLSQKERRKDRARKWNGQLAFNAYAVNEPII